MDLSLFQWTEVFQNFYVRSTASNSCVVGYGANNPRVFRVIVKWKGSSALQVEISWHAARHFMTTTKKCSTNHHKSVLLLFVIEHNILYICMCIHDKILLEFFIILKNVYVYV